MLPRRHQLTVPSSSVTLPGSPCRNVTSTFAGRYCSSSVAARRATDATAAIPQSPPRRALPRPKNWAWRPLARHHGTVVRGVTLQRRHHRALPHQSFSPYHRQSKPMSSARRGKTQREQQQRQQPQHREKQRDTCFTLGPRGVEPMPAPVSLAAARQGKRRNASTDVPLRRTAPW